MTCGFCPTVRRDHWVWTPLGLAATLLKAHAGPQGTMAWALQKLRLHQQVQGVPRAT